jgi:hypothetical protein
MSAARFTAQKRLLAIAKSSKVQYINHTVSTDTIYNGIIPCPQISYNQIIFTENPKCGCPGKPPRFNLDGGYPARINTVFYSGGTPTTSGPVYSGGGPGTSATNKLNGGTSLVLGPTYQNYNGGSAGSFGNGVYSGGAPLTTAGLLYSGGLPGTSTSTILSGGTTTPSIRPSINRILDGGGV